MSRYIVVGFSKPVEGREAEYNAWNNDIHLPEVMSILGFSSGQRFKVQIPVLGEMPGSYLSLCQLDADSPQAVEAAKKALATSVMQRTDAVDRTGGSFAGVFERFGPGKTVPGTKAGAFRLVGISQPREGREGEYDEWYERQHMPEVLTLPGIVSGQRYKLHSAMAAGIDISSFAYYELAANSVEDARKTLRAMGTANLGTTTATIREKTRVAVLEVCSARVTAPKNKAPA